MSKGHKKTEDLIVSLDEFCWSSDKIIELSRDILTCKNQEVLNDINTVYIEIIRCMSLLEQLAKVYAQLIKESYECCDKYSYKCQNNPWDPRCAKKKSSYGCSFLDPQC